MTTYWGWKLSDNGILWPFLKACTTDSLVKPAQGACPSLVFIKQNQFEGVGKFLDTQTYELSLFPPNVTFRNMTVQSNVFQNTSIIHEFPNNINFPIQFFDSQELDNIRMLESFENFNFLIERFSICQLFTLFQEKKNVIRKKNMFLSIQTYSKCCESKLSFINFSKTSTSNIWFNDERFFFKKIFHFFKRQSSCRM